MLEATRPLAAVALNFQILGAIQEVKIIILQVVLSVPFSFHVIGVNYLLNLFRND